MRLEKEFVVANPPDACGEVLDRDETYTALFPDTRVTKSQAGLRETTTRYSALGASGEARFVFRRAADGVRFHKICDGRVWQSLEGRLALTPVGEGRTKVRLEMEGSTKTFVPEFTIRAPMREQFDQMVASLRDRLSRA